MSTTDFPQTSLTVDMTSESLRSQRGSPTWEMVRYFPRQGEWTVEQYLALEDVKGLIEFNHGCLEFLPVTTWDHQSIVQFLFLKIRELAALRGWQTRFAPLRLRVSADVYREPDLLVTGPDDRQSGKKYPHGARILMEVVSPGSEGRQRDYEEKKSDYAGLGVPEYWIGDMQKKIVTVCQLDGPLCRDLGPYSHDEAIRSPSLMELSLTPNQIFGVMEENNE